jgi:hypothetical protein
VDKNGAIALNMQDVSTIDRLTDGYCCNLSVACFRQLIESADSEKTMWDLAFSICVRNNKNDDLCKKKLEELLKTHGVGIPETFADDFALGFPCLCHSNCAIKTPLPRGKVHKFINME